MMVVAADTATKRRNEMDKANFMELLNAGLASLLSILTDTVNFAKAELPSFIQEALTYWTLLALYKVIVMAFFAIVLLLVGQWSLRQGCIINHCYEEKDEKKRNRLIEKYQEDDETKFYILGWVAIVIGFIVFMALICDYLPTYLKAVTAPKLFLIENIRLLLR
jgi:uncharacterized protein YqhQ